jgi:hypothetical protein
LDAMDFFCDGFVFREGASHPQRGV